MTSPESRDPEIRRIVHPTTEELEEINSKVNYIKIIEDLKQQVKNCHYQLEITNKKVEEINKSLKDTQGNQEKQEKAIKQVTEAVQDLKNEMELMKKTQTEGRMEMEYLNKRTGITETSTTNRLQEIEEECQTLKIPKRK